MQIKIIRRDNRLIIRMKNNLANRVLSFFWNDFAAGMFLGISIMLFSGFVLVLAIITWFIRLEIVKSVTLNQKKKEEKDPQEKVVS